MTPRVCEIQDCGQPHFGRGLCNLHYHRLVRTPKKPIKMKTCAWCGERKPAPEFRHPSAARGKFPSDCQACRDANPTLGWCDFHNGPHPKTEFTPRADRPIGHFNECVSAGSIKASRKRGHAEIVCVSCGVSSESWSFRGGRQKCPTCRDCETAHPNEHYCADCEDWMPKQLFANTGIEGKFLTVRCRPCRTAHNHGVTVKWILAKQGSSEPECACCGSTDFLKIDHNHACCPTSNGCQDCVRGYLCHECNTAEGLLRTPERAVMLARYMQRVSVG